MTKNYSVLLYGRGIIKCKSGIAYYYNYGQYNIYLKNHQLETCSPPLSELPAPRYSTEGVLLHVWSQDGHKMASCLFQQIPVIRSLG